MAELSKSKLDALKPGVGAYILWDRGRLPGFGVKVLPTGRKVFFVDVRIANKTRRLTLGRYGPLTLDMARKIANDRLTEVAEGRDPTAEKRTLSDIPTVEKICDLYMEAAEAGLVSTRFKKPKKASTLAIDRGMIKRHIKPLIGDVRTDRVSRADVQKMIDSIASGKTAVTESTKPRGRARVTGGTGIATRTAELFGGIWRWAEKRGHVSGPSPSAGTDRIKGDPTNRRLSVEELRALGVVLGEAECAWIEFEAARKSAHSIGRRGPVAPKGLISPTAIVVCRLLAMTGLRPGEAASLRWAEIDLAAQTIALGDSKTGRSTRPIGKAAAQLIEGLPKLSDEWLFPAARGDRNSSFKKPLNQLLMRAKIAATPKVLRSTFASTAGDMGFSGGTIGDMLGHARQGVTERHYIRRIDAVLIAAANDVSEAIRQNLNVTSS